MKTSGESSARKFLTEYSVNEANNMTRDWKKLGQYLLVKYIDGNTKKQNEDGSFKNNGYCDSIPPTPEFPGYTDVWKKAVKENAGERLNIK